MKEAAKPTTLCPVCGYGLGFEPWTDESPSYEICPSCGIQFGYTDASPEGAAGRTRRHAEWRHRWIEEGMLWGGPGQKSLPTLQHRAWSFLLPKPPPGWDPLQQLRRIGVIVERPIEHQDELDM